MNDVDRLSDRGAGPMLPDVTALRLLCHAEQARAGPIGHPARWAEVAEAWEALSRPYASAYARWRQAEAATEDLAMADAQRAARAAYDVAESLGAQPLRDKVVALARRARFKLAGNPSAEDRPTAPVPNPFGLTIRERQVLTLLSAGQSNVEIAGDLFISVSTCATHVSNILAKLGVRRRAQAAALASRMQLLNDPRSE